MRHILILLTWFCFFLTGAMAQTDTLKTAQPDTLTGQTSKEEKEKKSKRRDEFILYAGISLNNLSVASERYDSEISPGYLLGAAYKRGKFFYWQAGVRFNSAGYNLKDLTLPEDSLTDPDNNFSVIDVDFPLNAGINLLSVTNRVMALRLFIGAIPSIALGVGDNDAGITKDKINSFNVYGQAGIGLNVAFMVIETGYNYGFMDIIENDIQSRPGQIFVNIGFRF